MDVNDWRPVVDAHFQTQSHLRLTSEVSKCLLPSGRHGVLSRPELVRL